MMDSEDFYIVLPSNVQPDFHPENTASSYRTTFDQSYDLSGGSWEVALSQITYVNSLYNIIEESYELFEENYPNTSVVIKSGNEPGQFKMQDDDSAALLIYDKESNRYSVKKRDPSDRTPYYMYKGAIMDLGIFQFGQPEEEDRSTIFNVLNETDKELKASIAPMSFILAHDMNLYAGKHLPRSPKFKNEKCFTRKLRKGFYNTAKVLCEALNPNFKELEFLLSSKPSEKSATKNKCDISWGYDEKRDRIIVSIGKGGSIEMKHGLHEIIGFRNNNLKEGLYVADYPPLLNRGIYNFYIYCSICEPVQVGNVKAPLLQTIAVEGGEKWGTPQTIRFTRPLYIPVNTSSFNSILMELRDDMGQSIHFGKGKTTLTLHFRKRSPRI